MPDSAEEVHERLQSGTDDPSSDGDRHRGFFERAIAMIGVTFAASIVGALFVSQPRPGASASDVFVDVVIGSQLGFLLVGGGVLVVGDFHGDLGLDRLPERGVLLREVVGIGLALAAVSVSVVTLLASTGEPTVPLVGDELGGEAEDVLLAMIPLSLFLVAPVEELFYRGLVQRHLRGGASAGGAIVGAALLFAASHLPQYTGLDSGLAIVLLVGVIFLVGYAAGRVYERTGSLPAAMGVHATYNCAVASFWYLDLTVGLAPV